MRVSIITPSFNQGEFIEQTIQSVLNQNHDDVEHIVIDGGSTDNTVSILKKYPHLIWVSEKDSGQSNAINKGFKRATGEILAWLNSDDFYEENIFKSIVEYFGAHPDCMLLYGDITFVDRRGHLLTSFSGSTIDYTKLVECPDIVRQPSSFWRRQVVEECNGVDENLHLVMDFDFFLRIGKRHRFHYFPCNLSFYRYYEQNKSLSMARRQVAEFYKVFTKNNIKLTARICRFLVGKYLYSFVPIHALKSVVRTLKGQL
jgi:glycosyltransferase involved in cell wall biosynthesis